MNALRDIKSASEIEVRLQSNEVLLHLPKDTSLAAVPEKIHEAGYKANTSIWLTAQGTWTKGGFLPEGWDNAIRLTSEVTRKNGIWELEFQKSKDGIWKLKKVKEADSIPQLQDEDDR